MQRRATFTSIAKQQVELAAAYRGKKWLDTAATRLVVADRFDRDAGLVTLERHKKGMRLGAYLKLGGKWVTLLHRDVAMDEWRCDGRHLITVEATATGLLAQCGNARIQVPRALLAKQTGGTGLFACNDGEAPVAVEFRAFKVGP